MNVILFFIGITFGNILMYIFLKKEIIKQEINAKKSKKNFDIISQWMILKHNNIGLDIWLKKRNIKRISIYGMGILGRHLVRELMNTNIEICYGIDSKKMKPYCGVPIKLITEKLMPVDMIIISVTYDNEKIKKILQDKNNIDVTTLENIIYESYYEEN